ncbi:hypothetical protein BDQ12DRAFT_684116, partial [Crucibulum laeve]
MDKIGMGRLTRFLMPTLRRQAIEVLQDRLRYMIEFVQYEDNPNIRADVWVMLTNLRTRIEDLAYLGNSFSDRMKSEKELESVRTQMDKTVQSWMTISGLLEANTIWGLFDAIEKRDQALMDEYRRTVTPLRGWHSPMLPEQVPSHMIQGQNPLLLVGRPIITDYSAFNLDSEPSSLPYQRTHTRGRRGRHSRQPSHSDTQLGAMAYAQLTPDRGLPSTTNYYNTDHHSEYERQSGRLSGHSHSTTSDHLLLTSGSGYQSSLYQPSVQSPSYPPSTHSSYQGPIRSSQEYPSSRPSFGSTHSSYQRPTHSSQEYPSGRLSHDTFGNLLDYASSHNSHGRAATQTRDYTEEGYAQGPGKGKGRM